MDDKLINKRQVEFLAMAGVFDELFSNRSNIFESSTKLVAVSKKLAKRYPPLVNKVFWRRIEQHKCS